MKSTKLKYFIALFVLVCGSDVFADIFGSGTNQFSIDFVPIGNRDNAADTTGLPNPAGAVGYNYSIAKFEVSEDMINKFNASQSLLITTDTRGTNKPATSVSWNEAARFTNWLNTSTGGFPAYKFTTSGVNDYIALWTPADALDYNAANPFRSIRANYVLPSFDEWYKAAYYDPNTNVYYDYPTGSDTVPTPVAGGTSSSTAVYFGQPGPADVFNAGGLSPLGVMGLGGNVYEWQETESDLVNNGVSSNRWVRGGDWGSSSSFLSSSNPSNLSPANENIGIGFRVASLSSIPEPSSMFLVGLGICVWSFARRLRTQNS